MIGLKPVFFNIFKNPKTVASAWVIAIISILFCLFFLTGWSYFKLDALVIWIFSCLSVLLLSQKLKTDESDHPDWILIILGILLAAFSFLNIPLGFGNPPYSIGDFSILLSGISLVFFGIIGKRLLFLPVVLPAIAVIGFQFYEKVNVYFQWLSAPLIPPIVASTGFLLKMIGTQFTIRENLVSFVSSTGEYVNLIISTDCTGIWSLGTFTITCIIILVSFPQARTGKSYVLFLVGYIGTYITNILRVWFIVLVGYYWGSLAAVKSAHDYFGWILFSIWVIIFWYFFITHHLNISIIDKINIR